MSNATTVSCNGINHSDFGTSTHCKNCGARVARREDGKVFDIHISTTAGGYERTVFSCFSRSHQCDAERANAYQAAVVRDLAAGLMIPGQSVVVARGRKFPKGITGKITWVGESDFGPRARVQPENGAAFFIDLKNLDTALA